MISICLQSCKMRWNHLGTSFCTKSKRSHILCEHSKIRNKIIDSTQFGFLQFHSYSYHSSTFLHAKVVKDGSVQQLHVGNHLLNVYVQSQKMGHAQKLFDEMLNRDVRTWTILISGFARNGSSRMALSLFKEMQIEGVCPNQFTFSSVLKCCSNANELSTGKELHGCILRSGVGLDVVLENSILDFYVKCGAFDHAKNLFESMVQRDTVSGNIMIGAYLLIGDTENSLDLFRRMPFKDVASWNTIIDGLMRNGAERIALDLIYQMVVIGHVFDKVTFSIALILVSSLLDLELGRQIHCQVLRAGFHDDGFVMNSLIEMYCKCGEMEKASTIFRKVPLDFKRKYSNISCDDAMGEIVAWSSMVSGYVQNGRWEDALQIFSTMVREKVEVGNFTLTSVVSACANAGILELGCQVHAHIHKIGNNLDVFLGSSVIDMYAKCGNLDDAWLIFKQINNRNVVLWTSMISGCALHGQGREASQLFESMINEGFIPNEISFVGVLNACSHAGLLEEGLKYFRLMKEVYGIKPGVEHFNCMVDLYGRAGRLNEAKEFIHKNGISHLTAVWRSFLSSCRLHKNIEMGRWVSDKLLELEPSDTMPYILLSNICATDHRWEEAAEVRSLMRKRGLMKHPGQSWIRLKNEVHTFLVGDRSHPQDVEIYSYLHKLIGKLKEIGYSTDVNLVMQDVEEEQGEALLGLHSEKLAVVYGIISTTSGSPIRVMKNLRVCTDCHNFIKCTSQLLGREIVVRDIHRFHHFKHGHCSCGDYW